MKKITKVILSVLCIASVGGGMAAMTACGNDVEDEIVITGSTSVQPLMQTLAGEYEKLHEGVKIDVGGGGSGVGVSDAQKGNCDFGMVSRELSDDESATLTSLKIADDGIALIVNKNCTVTDVTTAEVKALYEEGTPIQETIVAAISREGGSGTRSAFEELVGIEGDVYSGSGFEQASATDTVITNITGNNAGNTVGYISMGSLKDTVKALKFNGVEATTANVASGDYALARPFNICYREGSLGAAAQAFIDWIMGAEGQAIVAREGYITVS